MFRYLSATPLRKQRVIVRVDFNVPIAGGSVRDDFRIRVVLPTIRRLLAGGNRVVLLSHASDARQTLRPAARCLAGILHEPVAFTTDLRRPAKERVSLVENLRRWRGEEACDPAFARVLSRLGEVFVNDGFGVAHRRGASLTLLPRLLPSFLGLRFEEELRALDRVCKRPKRPLVALIGGAKIETKMPLLEKLLAIADCLLVGGATANALLHASGIAVGRSARDGGIRSSALVGMLRSPKLILPVDAVVSRGRGFARSRTAMIGDVGAGEYITDIGPRTIRAFAMAVAGARTVIWNGPVGLAEQKRYARGTIGLARAVGRMRGFSMVGGGDTVSALARTGLLKKFTFVSTGGGAMLTYLSGGKLPALEALKRGFKNQDS